ncbi:MAG: hypothetical protein WAO35_08935 [Terriglobia bacterium]
MKRSLSLTLIGVAVLLAVGVAIAKDKEGPITGTWNCQAKGGPEGDMPFTLYLQQNEESVDGSVDSPLGSTQISSGTFKGNTLEIHIESPGGTYVLVGKLNKGTLSGTFSRDDGSKGTWEGKKQEASN